MDVDDDDVFPPPEQYQVPKDPSKIRQRIRRYERSLEEEKRLQGRYGDGYGKRFLLGPFCIIMGDLDGALSSFAWFEKEFPDGSDMAPQLLCWTLALKQIGEDEKAQQMLRRTMFANLYIIPRLLGMKETRHDIWHGCNTSEPSYLSWVPDEYGSSGKFVARLIKPAFQTFSKSVNKIPRSPSAVALASALRPASEG